jgi:hypothetical protein
MRVKQDDYEKGLDYTGNVEKSGPSFPMVLNSFSLKKQLIISSVSLKENINLEWLGISERGLGNPIFPGQAFRGGLKVLVFSCVQIKHLRRLWGYSSPVEGDGMRDTGCWTVIKPARLNGKGSVINLTWAGL